MGGRMDTSIASMSRERKKYLSVNEQYNIPSSPVPGHVDRSKYIPHQGAQERARRMSAFK